MLRMQRWSIMLACTAGYLFPINLFVNKSGNEMQRIFLEILDQDWPDLASYSWVSVELAFLYGPLCRGVSIKRGKPASDIAFH